MNRRSFFKRALGVMSGLIGCRSVTTKEPAKPKEVPIDIPAVDCCNVLSSDYPVSYTITFYGFYGEDGKPHCFNYTVQCPIDETDETLQAQLLKVRNSLLSHDKNIEQ